MAQGRDKRNDTADQEQSDGKPPSWSQRFWGWTEFGKKSGWEWLQLLSVLLIPIVIALATLWFTAMQNDQQKRIETKRAQSTALQAYLDQMSELTLNENLSNSAPNSVTADLAKARTLTVLKSLDAEGKGSVVQFLWESALIWKPASPKFSLSNADLSGANLSEIVMYESALENVNLNGADMSDTNVDGSTLREATLIGANLQGVHLNNADLTGADLTDANLTGAELTGANFTDATVTQAQIDQAKAVGGITLRDGKVTAGRYVSGTFKPKLSLNVGDGWRLSYPESPKVISLKGPENGQIVLSNPSDVFDPDSPSVPTEVPAPENADEWASWFREHPNLKTSKPVPTSLGGASGVQFDVTMTSAPENYSREICNEQLCVPLFPNGSGGIVSYPGTKDRFIVVDREDSSVVINVAAPPGKFNEFAPVAQKLLETLEWQE